MGKAKFERVQITKIFRNCCIHFIWKARDQMLRSKVVQSIEVVLKLVLFAVKYRFDEVLPMFILVHMKQLMLLGLGQGLVKGLVHPK